MNRMIIGDTERELTNNIDEAWINQQINGRKEHNLPVCLKFIFGADSFDLALSSPSCNCGVVISEFIPNNSQKNIIDLWKKHRLNTNDFHGGNVVAFLKQIRC